MLVAFKNIIQHPIKPFGALKVFADIRHKGFILLVKKVLIALFGTFSFFVIFENFTTEQCRGEGSEGARNFCQVYLGVVH